MYKTFLLIRHGKTQGNLERRYLGDLEEPLCELGAREALVQSRRMPAVDRLFTGTARRCRQTAELLFPAVLAEPCQLTEIDFGIFKGKNAAELQGNREYEQWLATHCTGDIPGGDSVVAFKERSCKIFAQTAANCGPGTTAFVLHDGNIMAIMERFALPKRGFYSHHLQNCGFWLCRWENEHLYHTEEGCGEWSL